MNFVRRKCSSRILKFLRMGCPMRKIFLCAILLPIWYMNLSYGPSNNHNLPTFKQSSGVFVCFVCNRVASKDLVSDRMKFASTSVVCVYIVFVLFDLGAAIAFNSIYRELREEMSILKTYWIELLYYFVRSLWLSSEGDCNNDQSSQALDHIKRVLCDGKHIFLHVMVSYRLFAHKISVENEDRMKYWNVNR